MIQDSCFTSGGLWEHRHHVDGSGFFTAHHHIQVLNGLARGSLAYIVNHRYHNGSSRNAVFKHTDEVEV